MENQPIANPSENTPVDSIPISQPTAPTQFNTNLLVPILSSILLSGIVFGFGGYYLGVKQNSVANNEQKPLETVTSTPQTQNIAASPTTIPSITAQSKTYDGKFLSFNYPTSLFVWSFGRGVSLDYFQLNSVDQNDEQNPDKVVIAFDTQSLTYTEGQSIADQKTRVEGLQKQYPDENYVISNRTVDGTTALVYEMTIANSPRYGKTVWFIKNNVKYIISMAVLGSTQQSRDTLKSKYNPDFESIVNSMKLKYVDPAEVERLGNHPD